MPRHLAKPQAALLAVLCLCGSARALDPELTTPYKVQVVLRIGPNRILTPIFKEQLRRDLQRGLHAALGAMGEVEVIDLGEVKPDNQEPLWREVAAKGLQVGLDEASKRATGVKTHFVTVDYVDGQYEIQARQYDGLTGLASPAVRRERTPDRQFVARTAALLIDRDFGLVGTVADGGDGQTVRVAFKGGGLKVPLDRFVNKGDVLALVQVGADGGTARLPWTILRAEAAPGEDGSCTCKVFPPQQRAVGGAGAGLRCIKLGTIKAPLRIRVIEGGQQKKLVRALDNAIVYIGRNGFNDSQRTQGVPDNDGFWSSEKEKEPLYDGVAFVTVTQNGQPRTHVPIPIVDNRTTTIPVRSASEPSQFVARRSLWEQALLSEVLMLGELFRSLNEEIRTPEGRSAALERARKTLDRLGDSLTRYTEMRDELAKMKPPVAGKLLDLSRGDARIANVKKGRDDLRAWIANLEKIQKETGDQQEVRATYQQAHDFEKEGDYGRAIELYKKVLARTKDAKLEERLPKLEAAWKPKDETHAKARAFIYDTWPKLEDTAALMKKRIEQAQGALAVCRQARDPFGPRKLQSVADLHIKKLQQKVENLGQDGIEEQRAEAEELLKVIEGLESLIKDADAASKETPVP